MKKAPDLRPGLFTFKRARARPGRYLTDFPSGSIIPRTPAMADPMAVQSPVFAAAAP